MHVVATQTAPSPDWALRQRHLISVMNETARMYQARYTRADGTFVWRDRWPGMDGSDDGYESYHNWPLFYALGGAADLHEQSRMLWDAVTRQFTAYGQIHREFDGYYDWMHHGESSIYFYYFGLADPQRQPDRARALRFAHMYTGEDPEAQNWDPELRQMRSPINGSRGPRFKNSVEDWETHRWVLSDYPLPYEDLEVPSRQEAWHSGEMVEKADWCNNDAFAVILDALNRRMMRGDVPLNLTATSLVTHAYALTGDDKYRSWVLDYLESWADRIRCNNGICPDNVGPSGTIGECMDGKWWGGYYGWSWPHGFPTIIEPLTVAAMNAVLLTGDMGYLDIPRGQLDFVQSQGREDNGRWLVPHRRTDSGWQSFRPFRPQHLLQLYFMSFAEEDLARLERVPEMRNEWSRLAPGRGKGDDQHAGPWFLYLQGELPDYPSLILENQYSEVLRRMDLIRNDDGDPETWDVHHWQNRNPVHTESLLQLTCGGPQIVYHGGLLHTRLRYYDAQERRPGLPPDTAALVTAMDANTVSVSLANAHPGESRSLLVQGGAFGEHRITAVQADGAREDMQEAGSDRWVRVDLPAGRSVDLTVHLDRYAFRPSYAQPF
ncbi:MAG: hypothetical protein F4Y08_03640 [Caldilineaceae bacterium SB0662_bin_9]|uniref:Uncharacterized protein n=1 Tax=Caldilineaceae bacterium SB0662_bin_9 TaxID=2605258 RepID=A0A6B1DQJ4_9CHLR|nr:hypothetical protein [Caldilineaceae bacterium SB0662_bin_9]